MGTVKAIIGKDNYRVNNQVRDFQITIDEPIENKGGNRGPAPFEMLSVALASCIATTLKMYINLKGWEIETVTVEVDHKVKGEDRTNIFDVNIVVFADMDEKIKARLKYIATSCPVHKTLSSAKNEIRTKIAYYGK